MPIIPRFPRCAFRQGRFVTRLLNVHTRKHMHPCKCDAKQNAQEPVSPGGTGRETWRERNPEGEIQKQQTGPFGTSCYCKQLKCSFSLHRHIIFWAGSHLVKLNYTTTKPVLMELKSALTWSKRVWKEKSTIITFLSMHNHWHIWTLLLPSFLEENKTRRFFTWFSGFLKSHNINKLLSGSMIL